MEVKFKLLFILSLSLACLCQSPPSSNDWTNAINKAKSWVSGLTVQEKVNLTTGVGWQYGPCVGNTMTIPSKNFEGFCLQDSPAGVRFVIGVSGFPAGINVASTWNRTEFYLRGQAIGAEFHGSGVHIGLGPMMNMGRVPAGGRNWEGFGADPFLTGEAAYQTILGIQSQGVVACAKHYILNEQEHYRTNESSNIDQRTIHEIYGWPFLRSVQAGVGSVMCSYNLINGTYACENPYTLTTMLKNEFGFQGYVMSDWSATMSGLPSVNAGLDMTMPGDITFGSGTTYFGQNLVGYVNGGQVSQDRLTDMAVRIMTPYFLLGQDQGYPAVDFDFRNASIGSHADQYTPHVSLIRQIGADSNILLKNTGTLPFTSSIGGTGNYTFALIGSDAGPANFGSTGCSDHGCDDGTLPQGWGSGTSWFPYLIDPVTGITTRATQNGQTVTSSLSDTDLAAAQAAAQSANIAIVFVNADSGEGYITVETNYGDRNNLDLWHGGDALIEAVASVNNRTIVVMHVVGPVIVANWIDNPNVTAVILAGLPGEESGNSLADVLFGDVNPSAKLPYTIGKSSTDYPAAVIYTSATLPLQIPYTENLLMDYRWFDQHNAPSFEFGFGLSYTTFVYSNLVVKIPSTIQAGAQNGVQESLLITASVTISNTGSRLGAEVAQLYLSYPASVGEPLRVLKGFDKVWVQQGSTATANFNITNLLISYWDVTTSKWTIPSGNFTIWVGASSRNLPLQYSFYVNPSSSGVMLKVMPIFYCVMLLLVFFLHF